MNLCLVSRKDNLVSRAVLCLLNTVVKKINVVSKDGKN